jgi:hypothetical protein
MDLRRRELQSVWLLLAVLITAVPARTASAKLRGDVNCNGTVAADDLTALAASIFNDASFDCDEADVNVDGRIGGADVTALVDVLETPVPIGPVVSFFGLAKADDTLLPRSGTNEDGIPVFSHPSGRDFWIVVEGKPGSDGCKVGPCAQGVPTDQLDCTPLVSVGCVSSSSDLPDLQIEASNPLGSGSPAVCDRSDLTPDPGGVPGVFPVTFDLNANPNIVDIVNDLACRFVDGSGQPIGRAANYPCVKDAQTEEYRFADPTSTVEFCAFITAVEQFPPAADTTLTVRLRDVIGNVGAPAQIVIHAGP